MRGLGKQWWLGFLLGTLALVPLSFAQGATEAEPCGTIANPRGQRFEAGLVFQSLIPSGLPNLNSTIPVYGPVLGLPLFGGTLQLQGVVGTEPISGLFLLLTEATYRLEINFPYLNTFALFGAHLLRFEPTAGPTYQSLGLHTGLGLSFLMGDNFELAFSLRTYIQNRTTLVFGGGFSFLL